ncbi:inactive transglutaminase family protein [bacterium]|nr:inactive transglutaminase family protein [bacterium]MBU1958980.1 inactive transglutaminase family protein [bacterium]
MSSRLQILVVTIFLSSLGIAVALYKGLALGIPFTPNETTSIYRLGAKISFKAKDEPIKISLAIPSNQNGIKILSQETASQGYGYNIATTEQGQRAEWTKRESTGQQSIFYSVDVVMDKNHHVKIPDELPSDKTEENLDEWDSQTRDAAEALLAEVHSHSADDYSFTAELLKRVNEEKSSQLLSLFKTKDSYNLEKIVYKLLRYKGIHVRIVNAITLEGNRQNMNLKPYLEVYDGKNWQLFSLKKGKVIKPKKLFIWQRGGVSLLDSFGTENAKVKFSISQRLVPIKEMVLEDSLAKKSMIIDLSLFALPTSEQNAFRHILLIPIGALVVVFMRIIIGLRTSGTFMPILLALAFMETKLVTGLILFVSIVGMGLIIRSYLSHLNLLLVARISSVVIVVIGIMSIFSIVSYKLGINEALTITFFPMIILAWTIERMSILWEEEGAKEVYMQGGGSLLVAVLAYFAMSNELVGYLSFNFSELLLVVLSIIILIGRYSGYRLFELIRFNPVKEF